MSRGGSSRRRGGKKGGEGDGEMTKAQRLRALAMKKREKKAEEKQKKKDQKAEEKAKKKEEKAARKAEQEAARQAEIDNASGIDRFLDPQLLALAMERGEVPKNLRRERKSFANAGQGTAARPSIRGARIAALMSGNESARRQGKDANVMPEGGIQMLEFDEGDAVMEGDNWEQMRGVTKRIRGRIFEGEGDWRADSGERQELEKKDEMTAHDRMEEARKVRNNTLDERKAKREKLSRVDTYGLKVTKEVGAHVGSGLSNVTKEVDPDFGRKLPDDDVLRVCFDKVDLDGSGQIDLDEFIQCIPLLGFQFPMSPEETFKYIDTNGNGTLDFEEFKTGLSSAACVGTDLSTLKRALQKFMGPVYEQWDAEKLLSWMKGIANGVYRNEAEMIYEANIQGRHLPKLTMPMLRKLGMKNYTTRRALFYAIQDYINRERLEREGMQPTLTFADNLERTVKKVEKHFHRAIGHTAADEMITQKRDDIVEGEMDLAKFAFNKRFPILPDFGSCFEKTIKCHPMIINLEHARKTLLKAAHKTKKSIHVSLGKGYFTLQGKPKLVEKCAKSKLLKDVLETLTEEARTEAARQEETKKSQLATQEEAQRVKDDEERSKAHDIEENTKEESAKQRRKDEENMKKRKAEEKQKSMNRRAEERNKKVAEVEKKRRSEERAKEEEAYKQRFKIPIATLIKAWNTQLPYSDTMNEDKAMEILDGPPWSWDAVAAAKVLVEEEYLRMRETIFISYEEVNGPQKKEWRFTTGHSFEKLQKFVRDECQVQWKINEFYYVRDGQRLLLTGNLGLERMLDYRYEFGGPLKDDCHVCLDLEPPRTTIGVNYDGQHKELKLLKSSFGMIYKGVQDWLVSLGEPSFEFVLEYKDFRGVSVHVEDQKAFDDTPDFARDYTLISRSALVLIPTMVDNLRSLFHHKKNLKAQYDTVLSARECHWLTRYLNNEKTISALRIMEERTPAEGINSLASVVGVNREERVRNMKAFSRILREKNEILGAYEFGAYEFEEAFARDTFALDQSKPKLFSDKVDRRFFLLVLKRYYKYIIESFQTFASFGQSSNEMRKLHYGSFIQAAKIFDEKGKYTCDDGSKMITAQVDGVFDMVTRFQQTLDPSSVAEHKAAVTTGPTTMAEMASCLKVTIGPSCWNLDGEDDCLLMLTVEKDGFVQGYFDRQHHNEDGYPDVIIEAQCPGMHPLDSFKLESVDLPDGTYLENPWWCLRCGEETTGMFPLGSTFYGCRICDWDICEECKLDLDEYEDDPDKPKPGKQFCEGRIMEEKHTKKAVTWKGTQETSSATLMLQVSWRGGDKDGDVLEFEGQMPSPTEMDGVWRDEHGEVGTWSFDKIEKNTAPLARAQTDKNARLTRGSWVHALVRLGKKMYPASPTWECMHKLLKNHVAGAMDGLECSITEEQRMFPDFIEPSQLMNNKTNHNALMKCWKKYTKGKEHMPYKIYEKFIADLMKMGRLTGSLISKRQTSVTYFCAQDILNQGLTETGMKENERFDFLEFKEAISRFTNFLWSYHDGIPGAMPSEKERKEMKRRKKRGEPEPEKVFATAQKKKEPKKITIDDLLAETDDRTQAEKDAQNATAYAKRTINMKLHKVLTWIGKMTR